MRYFGFYAKDNYADNTELYERLLKDLNVASQIGYSEKYMRGMLEFYKRFPPGNTHSRLVGHSVDIYSIEKPVWRYGRDCAHPIGKMKNVFSVDLGKAIMLECTGKKEEVIDTNYVHLLEDGTEVRGVRVRVTKNKGSPRNRTIENDYLNIAYDSSRVKESGEFSYQFDIKRDKINLNNIFVYHVLEYVDIDGERVMERMETAAPSFDLTELEKPGEFTSLSYRHPIMKRKLLLEV